MDEGGSENRVDISSTLLAWQRVAGKLATRSALLHTRRRFSGLLSY